MVKYLHFRSHTLKVVEWFLGHELKVVPSLNFETQAFCAQPTWSPDPVTWLRYGLTVISASNHTHLSPIQPSDITHTFTHAPGNLAHQAYSGTLFSFTVKFVFLFFIKYCFSEVGLEMVLSLFSTHLGFIFSKTSSHPALPSSSLLHTWKVMISKKNNKKWIN